MNYKEMNFKDKVVIVTGAARGIGNAVVKAFASCDANVVLCDLDEPGIRQTSDEINNQGVKSLHFKMDVGKRSEVAEAFGQVLSRWGAPDILVNSAGIITRNEFLDDKDEDWDRVLSVNLKGTWLCSQTAARLMVASKKPGAIVNICSTNSEISDATQVIYTASKGGVRSLTKGMAIALAPYGIRVNAVSPTAVNTDMNRQFFKDHPEQLQRRLRRLPIGRLSTPDDVVGAVLYLASDWATFATGTNLVLDGGRLSQNNV